MLADGKNFAHNDVLHGVVLVLKPLDAVPCIIIALSNSSGVTGISVYCRIHCIGTFIA